VLPVSNVQKMLRHHVYCGVISMNGELFPGAFEPIVSKRLFDAAQEMMSFKSRPTRKRKHSFPFTSFLRCACCGCAISAEIQKGRHYYRCTHKRGLCDQRKYLREDGLLMQVRTIVEQVSLPDVWANNMLAELDKEKAKGQLDHRASIQHLEDERKQTDTHLDDLLDLRLASALTTEEYLAKKNKLVSRKVEIGQEIKNAQQNRSHWLEPMREMIIRSREAKKLLTTENYVEFPTFLKTIGTNFVLKGNAVQWEAAIGWRALAQSTGFRTWWVGRDSLRRARPSGSLAQGKLLVPPSFKSAVRAFGAAVAFVVGRIRSEWNTLIPYMEQIAAVMQQKVGLANNNEITVKALVVAAGK